MSGKRKVEDSDPPLPKGWTKGFSRSQQKTYYCHPASKHTQWHFPTASEAQDPRMAKKRLEQNNKIAPSNKVHDEASALGDILGSGKIQIQAKQNAPKRQRTNTDPSRNIDSDATCVAIIVPYRDIHPTQNRARHLQQFIPYMHKFLQKQLDKGALLDYHIYIVEQSNDNRKFNRGKLLNIGFDIARKNKCRPSIQGKAQAKHDVFIFHDVDLLPGNDLGTSYTQLPTVPIHIARVWDRYSNNPKYFGGIVSFSEVDMKRINGYPNTFWGWGGEDDEMQKRCEKLGIRWKSPMQGGTITDLEDMNLQEKLSFLKQNKNWKCMVKWEALEEHDKTWRSNGLADLSYKVEKLVNYDEDGNEVGMNPKEKRRATKITVDVKLNGDHWSNERAGMDYVWKG